MDLAQTLIAVYCVIRVVWCRDFSITLPKTVEAVSGLCVAVPCQFQISEEYDSSLSTSAKGKWLKDDNDELVFDSTTPDGNKIKGEMADVQMKNCTTVFTKISIADSDTYHFRIEGGAPKYLRYSYKTQGNHQTVTIKVDDTPSKPSLSLYVDQKEVQNLKSVMEGSSVNLICSALAPCPSNPPTLTWTPLQPDITQQHQNSSFISSNLSFTASHLHDGQSITCSAAYSLEDTKTKTVQSSRLLRVLYHPRNTSVSVPSGPVLLGGSVSLSCSSDGNPAVQSFTWFRENGEQIGTGETLTITEINETHSGLYYCRAQNPHGTHNSSVLLDVQYPPRNLSISVSPPGPVLLGSLVSLICSSDGNPAANYTWDRGTEDIIETGPTLTITRINDTHSGLYNCRAQNRHGNKTTFVRLNVQYPPRNTSVSVSPPGPVLLGSSVSLNCSSDGNPAVLNYTWSRENGEQIGTGDAFMINATNETHSGLYYCRAQNLHGTQNISLQLDLHFPPKVSLSSTCTSNNSVILCVCEVHGFPVPTLEWLLSGQPVPPIKNSSIRVEAVGSTGLRSFFTINPSDTDTPTLQCISSNNLGSSAQIFYPVAAPDSCFLKGFTHIPSMIVGAAAGASAVMLLCIMYMCGRKHHKPSHEENAGLVLNDRAVYQDEEEESMHTKKSSKRAPNPSDPDILHYSSISFPDGEDVSREIRGLSSLTSEYATVQHGFEEQRKEEAGDYEATQEITAAEIEPPLAEEVTYGNIVRQNTFQPDVGADVMLEQTETRTAEPERSIHSEAAESLYAEVKPKEHKQPKAQKDIKA